MFWRISCEMTYHGFLCGISGSSRKIFGWKKPIGSKWDLQVLNLFLIWFNRGESLVMFMVCCKMYTFIQSHLNWMFCLIFKNHSEWSWLYSVLKNTLSFSHYCKFYQDNTLLHPSFSFLQYILLWLCLYFIAFYVTLQNILQNIWQYMAYILRLWFCMRNCQRQ